MFLWKSMLPSKNTWIRKVDIMKTFWSEKWHSHWFLSWRALGDVVCTSCLWFVSEINCPLYNYAYLRINVVLSHLGDSGLEFLDISSLLEIEDGSTWDPSGFWFLNLHWWTSRTKNQRQSFFLQDSSRRITTEGL